MCQESLEGGEQRFICEPSLSGLGDAEINHLLHGHAILRRHQHVRGFDVAMDDAFLMRVWDRAADLDEQVQTLSRGELVLIAVIGDLDAADQFHHEVRPAGGKLRVGNPLTLPSPLFCRAAFLASVVRKHAYLSQLETRSEPRDYQMSLL